MATCLGFDYGTKKIGVAVGDSEVNIANGLTTVRAVNQKTNWLEITKIIEEWKPKILVVGVSRKEDGSDNEVTPRMLKFSRQLEGRYGCKVALIDEGLTTFEAKQMLFDEAQLSADTMWEVQDQMAAQLILQSWLNENMDNR